MKLVWLGKPIKNQLVEDVINIFVNTEIKTIKNAEEIQSQDANFVLNIIYRMRSKTFRRKLGKMSRRRRAGQNPTNMLGRTTTADYVNMEEGFAPTAPPMEQMGMLGRSNTTELDNMERGYAPTVPVRTPMNMMGRSNTSDLNAMEEGTANPKVAIDVESTPDIEMGMGANAGGKRRRKSRKSKKSRKSRRR